MAENGSTDGFVHLHVHSHYSLLDGSATTAALAEEAARHGSPALALTDHGNLFGAVDFYITARDAGIKPILGIEAYISPTDRHDRSMRNQETACYHLILLAMNDEGFRNLMRLSSRAFREGFYYKPRLDRALLAEYHAGLICTTACLGGEVPAALLGGDHERALRIAGEYRDIFGRDRFFVEVQNQGLDDQARINPGLVKIAETLGVGLVGTNDVHFLRKDDKPAHEVLCCVSTGRTLAESRENARNGGSMSYPPTLYLRPPAEMREVFREFPGACDNTLTIAEMCNVELDFGKEYLPAYDLPDDEDDDTHLRRLAEEGLRRRFDGGPVPDEYRRRLDRELAVIGEKGYSSYFLICHDFVEYAGKHDIPASPRGSGLSSLLCYVLGIAEVDPLRYGLLFERFTDPRRQEPPDLDIDICQEGRGEILRYVREKYGQVAQIITYGTLKARAVLKDVGRVLGYEPDAMDRLTAKVPNELKMTLAKALDQEPDLKKLYEEKAGIKRMFDFGRQLEGLCRHAGVHAAGVIIADLPLDEVVPLYTQGQSDEIITQWDGPTCEKVGLMKMDFLGLKTLTILKKARRIIRERTGVDIDPEKLPLDDPAVYELFQAGHTDGVFQFESDGMKAVLKQIRPEKINDLIAANAMYRPGPMELIPSYCARKHGREEIPSVHPLVDDILAETYGIMTYQEQVMLVLNRLGKLPLNRALTLIKAISKKKEKQIAAEKPHFIAGAGEHGIAAEEAERLFSLILKFAGYGFNKSHSTRYAIVAYQTAYFKVHYPREFFAAMLTCDSDDTDKVVHHMAEADRMGIAILPPDINTCGADFTVDGDAVRFGLAAVKGVGHSAVDAVVAAREEVGRFTDLYHFCEYADLRKVNRATVEALVKCGAFDSLGASRAGMIAALDDALSLGSDAAIHRRSGQLDLFGTVGPGGSEDRPPPRFPDVEPWSESEMLAAEKETLGFYISSHPLVKYGRELASLSSPAGVSLTGLATDRGRFRDNTPVRVGCSIVSCRPVYTKKKGDKMAMLTLEDITGTLDAVVFPRTYARVAEKLEPDSLVFISGTIDRSRNRPQIIVEEVAPLDGAVASYTASLTLRLPAGAAGGNGFLAKVAALLQSHRGNCPVLLETRSPNHPDVLATIRAGEEYFVHPTRALIDGLEELLADQERILLAPKAVKIENNRRFGKQRTG